MRGDPPCRCVSPRLPRPPFAPSSPRSVPPPRSARPEHPPCCAPRPPPPRPPPPPPPPPRARGPHTPPPAPPPRPRHSRTPAARTRTGPAHPRGHTGHPAGRVALPDPLRRARGGRGRHHADPRRLGLLALLRGPLHRLHRTGPAPGRDDAAVLPAPAAGGAQPLHAHPVAARRLRRGRRHRPPRRHGPARPAGAGPARDRGPPPAPRGRTAPGPDPSGHSRAAAGLARLIASLATPRVPRPGIPGRGTPDS